MNRLAAIFLTCTSIVGADSLSATAQDNNLSENRFYLQRDNEDRIVEASVTKAKDEWFKEISRFQHLRQLAILESDLSTQAYVEIAKCKSIEALILIDSEIDDASAKEIATLGQLTDLYNVCGDKLTGTGLACFSELKKLKAFYIAKCGAKSGDFGFLRKMRSLKILGVGDADFSDADLDAIPGDSLRNLSLLGSSITSKSVDKLSSMRSLAFLTLQVERFDEQSQRLLRNKLSETFIIFRPIRLPLPD